ncbi:MAG: aldolase, partial [Actinomycetota bacterium]|nr:aldolase [Actinomycetota bacterium]
MPSIARDQVRVPADVPVESRETYIDNFMAATHGTGRLMLFACDQKIEHLNDDFFGEGIAAEDAEPEHLFRIGSQGVCGVLAGQRGLVAQYAADYPDINYLVKMNSKTHLVKTSQDPAKHQDDPYSPQLYDIQTVLDLRDNGVNVVGIGYTIYIGSEYESQMMMEAAQLIADAHLSGLLVVLWMYPRGKAVADEKDAHLIAGAAGVAVSIGADFVKVNPPKGTDAASSAELLKEASLAAGRTGLVCAGGS